MAGVVSDYDEVPCLHVPVWWFSDEFFTRHRTCNWPPEAVRDNIRRYGLHLVPVGAPGSATKQLQFRLSFSRAEVVIALHLTKAQRYAVIAFKKCKAALGEEGKVLKSYFVKTALLWLCEQTPTEDWTSVTQGVLKLLDYLDKAVSTGKLPCYFWSRINILRFTSRADRKAMKKTLGNIRQHLMRLLVHELCVLYPALREKLTRETRRLSERQLRVCLKHWRIRVGVHNSMTRYMTIFIPDHLNKLLPVLLRSNTHDEVITMLRGLSLYRVQEALYQALIVAPADVASHVRFSASGGGGFVWDAAPLLELLTEDDLKKLLGEPDTVRAWLRRQHQLPETERPASLPADLRSPRDLCDLLLNIPLLICVLKESVPGKWAEIQCKAAETTLIAPPIIAPLQKARQEVLKFSARWSELADDLQHELRMDRQAAVQMACRVGVELRQLCDDPETLAEHRRISHSLPDPWQLRQFVFGSSA